MRNFVHSLKVYCTIAIFCFPLICFGVETKDLPADRVVRAALDIGSGATKLRVAVVNLKTNKIEKILANESYTTNYQEELEKARDGAFDEKIMQIGLDALKKSKAEAMRYGATNVVAVATASFRKATNADAFIDRIYKETGIKVHVIDQNLEGILAFEAVSSNVDSHPENLLVWDIGGGSFQFTTLDEKGELTVYRGVDASVPFKNHIIKYIKLQDLSQVQTPNPLTMYEIQQSEIYSRAISQKVDKLFKDKIRDPNTHILGVGNIFAYGIKPLTGGKDRFTAEELRDRILELANKTDNHLGGGDYVNVSVTNPILVLGFMQTLGIKEMDILDINNADGAILYPAFWENKPAMQQESVPEKQHEMVPQEPQRQIESTPQTESPAACHCTCAS